MEIYKVKKDYSDGETGRMMHSGDTVTVTPERAAELRAAGVIGAAPVASEPAPEAPEPKKEK